MNQLKHYDENNYYFYFTKSDSNAYKIMEQCTQRYGELTKIDNIISFDCNENFQYRLPITAGVPVLNFVFGLIHESAKLLPSILDCRIRDIAFNLRTRCRYNVENNSTTINAINLIKQEQDLTDRELLSLITNHYGLYSIGTRYDNYDLYQADNYIIADCSSEMMKLVLGEDADITLLEKLDAPVNPTTSKWKTEEKIYFSILRYYPDALQHYSPIWLDRQHLDVYIPSLSIAIEYQGKQHFEPIEFFGGVESFAYRKDLDQRKRMLCEANGITLIEFPYDIKANIANILTVLCENGIHNFPHPIMNPIPPDKKSYYQKVENLSSAAFVPVIILNQFSLEGKFIHSFKGYAEAVKSCSVSKISIYRAASGYALTAGGYQWRFGSSDAVPEDIDALDLTRIQAVVQYSLAGEKVAVYKSLSAAAKALNIDPSNLRTVLNSETKTAGGFRWKREEKNENVTKYDYKPVEIVQFDLHGNKVADYASITQAEKNTGINRKSIRWAISGKQKTAGGYIWRKTNETEKSSGFDLRHATPFSQENSVIMQVTLDGEVICEYPSIARASEITGIERKAISRVINGRQRAAGGYYWIRKSNI